MTIVDLPNVPGLARQSTAVRRKLVEIAERNNWDVTGMARAIAHESGWNPRARNPSTTRATGLIQWTKDTAPLYGTTVDEILDMPADEQLELAEEYWRRGSYGRGIGPEDFLVLGIGTGNIPGGYRPGLPDSTVLYEPGSRGARGNAGLTDDTGAITIGTMRAALRGVPINGRIPIDNPLGDVLSGSVEAEAGGIVRKAMVAEMGFWLFSGLVFVVKVVGKHRR